MMHHYYLKWHQSSKILAVMLVCFSLAGSALVLLTDRFLPRTVYMFAVMLPLVGLLLQYFCRRWALCVMTRGLAWRDELVEPWQRQPCVGYVDWRNVVDIERCPRRLSSRSNTLIRFRRDGLLAVRPQHGAARCQAVSGETYAVVLETHLLAGDEDEIFMHLCRYWQAANDITK